MLPKGKKNQVQEAIYAAEVISKNAQIIMDEIDNKNKHSGLQRRETSQRAYTEIEHACFRCHNIVRDKVK